MANQRVFDEVSAATFNTIPIGGITSINTTQEYQTIINADLDFSSGPSERVLAIQRLRGQIKTSDVLQMIALLTSTPTAGVFFGKESASANFQQTDLKNPRFFAVSFDSNLTGIATITTDFQCIFDPTDTFAVVQQVTGGILPSVPQRIQPSRMWRPTINSFGTSNLNPLHLQSLTFRISPRGGQPLEDFGDGDIGITVVEIPGWDMVSVTLTIRDSKETVTGTSTKDIGTLMLEEGVGDLKIDLIGVGNVPNKTMTLRNCSFQNRQKVGGPGWTGHTLNGALQWRDPTGTPPIDRDLIASPLITFA